ncbi:hypothetical protein K504DRAFT_442736 [Pleomassaria siparia CBS 279.74]|uniref:SET domain-containing protein n=1 Tax=Pleomassaria siparia CBS 279.74 TaxID=1314801 RepID=A0A6G1JUP2_9PLEO|nr:hypothetical protein K504DRAFT_442736 [Pleomassaria siparia CBS 279.74]
MAGRDVSPTSIASAHSSITVHTEKQSVFRSSMSASPPTSTPPTSHGDEVSVLSDATKMDGIMEQHEETARPQTPADAHVAPQPTPVVPSSEGRRSVRSSRSSVVTYNVQILAGTAIHTPSKYLEKHHKNVLHGELEQVIKTNTVPSPKKKARRASKPSSPEDANDPAEEQLAAEAAQAAQRRTSSRVVDLRREAFRNLTAAGDAVGQALTNGREIVQNALRKSASDSRLIDSNRNALLSTPKRPRTTRGALTETDTPEREQEKVNMKPKTKTWLKEGLYVGQYRDFDPRLSEAQNRLKKKSARVKENRVLPLPLFDAERRLNADPLQEFRHFKLPFDTYNPLPRKVKVDGWVKLNKNRFIGDASALWKKDKQDSSSCYCSPEDGCGEDCHNRIMAYECDGTNCKLSPEQCGNRPFSQLKRRAKGNGYDYGVEVLHTEDRGYGVRAMRTFEPHQIIVEYAGEIITQAECERRMKQVYKKDKCYYLMSFDNKMIIDATRGTIARFVNHSCEPNCEMIKWTVGGEPRMALFAGSRGIMTGDELTYDYNFDPFSSKNIQECRCGTASCRGVLGPKPKKPAPEEKSLASSLLSGTKRKISEVFGRKTGDVSSPKKRKLSAMASAAWTKAQNAAAEEDAARIRSERNAAELRAQQASRENRAMMRSTSMQLSSKRSKVIRKATRVSMPNIKSTRRTTTVDMKRKSLPLASAPKSAPKTPRLGSMAKHGTQTPKVKKSLPTISSKTRKSPLKIPSMRPHLLGDTTDEEEGDDESPNITPASLRSAAKKLTQTKLPFKPLNLNDNSSSHASGVSAVANTDDEVENDDEDEDVDMDESSDADSDCTLVRLFSVPRPRKEKTTRGNASTSKSIHKTGAGVKKSVRHGFRS